MFNVKEKLLGKRTRVKKKEAHADYDHTKQINQFLKVIQQCDMPENLKRIMRTRIWGMDPKVFNPMTCEQIACMNKGLDPSVMDFLKGTDITYKQWVAAGFYRDRRLPSLSEVAEIEAYERQGIFHCEQFLLSHRSQDIVNSFNKNVGTNKDDIFKNGKF